MENTKKDFDKLLLNVYDIKKDVMSHFPILEKYEIFSAELIQDINRDQLLRYIVLAFDRNTPFLSIQDILERRVEAAKEAGFKILKNGFKPSVEELIRSRNRTVNHMILQYCILQGSEDYTTLVVFQEALRNQREKLMDGDIEDEKTKEIILNINKLRSEIKDIESSLMQQKDETLLGSLYDFSESKRLKISPEDYAGLHTS